MEQIQFVLSGGNGEFLPASALSSIPGEVKEYHDLEFPQLREKLSKKDQFT